jgi:hypothetical protein
MLGAANSGKTTVLSHITGKKNFVRGAGVAGRVSSRGLRGGLLPRVAGPGFNFPQKILSGL